MQVVSPQLQSQNFGAIVLVLDGWVNKPSGSFDIGIFKINEFELENGYYYYYYYCLPFEFGKSLKFWYLARLGRR